jgi:hypothetical protein
MGAAAARTASSNYVPTPDLIIHYVISHDLGITYKLPFATDFSPFFLVCMYPLIGYFVRSRYLAS